MWCTLPHGAHGLGLEAIQERIHEFLGFHLSPVTSETERVRPPCHENQAEYQGKCYMPVSAKSHEKKLREPHFVQP